MDPTGASVNEACVVDMANTYGTPKGIAVSRRYFVVPVCMNTMGREILSGCHGRLIGPAATPSFPYLWSVAKYPT